MAKNTKTRLAELQKQVSAKLEQSTISNFDEASKFQPTSTPSLTCRSQAI
jgi:hypothetical protein